MDTIIYVTEPLHILTAISAVMLVIGTALHYFNKKYPQVGTRIKDMTPWAGWTEKEIDDPYDGFRIHRSNYIHG